MDATPSAHARLLRLERYLQQDPSNVALLGEACDAAMATGATELALAHIAAAEDLDSDRAAWTFRRARVCLVQRKLPEAAQLLDDLLAVADEHPGLVHDRAYVAFLEGDDVQARALLAPALEGPAGPEERAALQQLWLRATHRLGLVREGWAWAQEQRARGALAPEAQGVASLLAVDADDFLAARELADAALAGAAPPLEAVVARATVAMAERQWPQARRLLQRALQLREDDGRTWSMSAILHLQAGEFAQAQVHCERALQTMPEHVGTWHALGWARLLQRDVAAALQAFEGALARDRNFAESHGAVGLALLLLGRREEAERHLQLADRLDPRNVTAAYARAVLSGEAGDAQRVQSLAARLLDRPGFFGKQLNEDLSPVRGSPTLRLRP